MAEWPRKVFHWTTKKTTFARPWSWTSLPFYLHAGVDSSAAWPLSACLIVRWEVSRRGGQGHPLERRDACGGRKQQRQLCFSCASSQAEAQGAQFIHPAHQQHGGEATGHLERRHAGGTGEWHTHTHVRASTRSHWNTIGRLVVKSRSTHVKAFCDLKGVSLSCYTHIRHKVSLCSLVFWLLVCRLVSLVSWQACQYSTVPAGRATLFLFLSRCCNSHSLHASACLLDAVIFR